MGRECRTQEEDEYRITLYWENKQEEIPGRSNGTLADKSKMHVREYANQEVTWSERFRIIDSCRKLLRTFIFPDIIFKLSDKAQSYNKFSIRRKLCWRTVIRLTPN
jgi:hypothetical protein